MTTTLIKSTRSVKNLEDMEHNVGHIIENYSLEELSSLKALLVEVEEKKKADLESAITIYKFSKEYSNYIRITFSKK